MLSSPVTSSLSLLGDEADSAPPLLSGQHKLTLLAKSTGDWTRKLNSIASIHMAMSEKGGFGVGRTVKLSIEGAPRSALTEDWEQS